MSLVTGRNRALMMPCNSEHCNMEALGTDSASEHRAYSE